jgi:hypothetical protein
MRRTELLVSARKRRRCPEHLSPFATCHMRSWRGSGDPALLRSSWIRRKGRFSHSRAIITRRGYRIGPERKGHQHEVDELLAVAGLLLDRLDQLHQTLWTATRKGVRGNQQVVGDPRRSVGPTPPSVISLLVC